MMINIVAFDYEEPKKWEGTDFFISSQLLDGA